MANYEYDAVVIGGGSAGLTASGIAANVGAKTMMVEAEKLGGDCTWTGCVPSKILLKAAKIAQQMRQGGKYGLMDAEPQIDFKKIMRHLRTIRQNIYDDADAPENFEAMGIEVVQGHASFVDEHTVKIQTKEGENRSVSSRYVFICAGASPMVPAIKGLDTVNYLTTETLFDLQKLPEQLLIIGAGNVGTEMAQAIHRLGAEVTVIDRADRILTKDNAELADMLYTHLKEAGIRYVLKAKIKEIKQNDSLLQISVEVDGKKKMLSGDALLVATGRQPNIRELKLDAAGIKIDEKGIKVNAKCRTNQPHIYACGDITGDYFFTHMSDHMAKIAVTNALLKIPTKVDADHVPWCTYCDPELAHLGATERQLQANNRSYEVFRFPYSKLDRAVMKAEAKGMIKVYAKKWNGKILGVDILGAHAGELISEYAVAMKGGISLGKLSSTIHPYPTYALGARRAADQWFIRQRPVRLLKMAKKLFGYRGEIPDLDEGHVH